MADYNIYIHTVSTSGESSPTTPWQLRPNESSSGNAGEVIGGKEFNPSTAVRRAGAFLTNPDSLIGNVTNGISSMGIFTGVAVTWGSLAAITNKAVTLFLSYSSPASGQYKTQIDYNNFKQALHNALTPFSTEIQRQQNELQNRKQTLVGEEQMKLLGGTMLNSPYGRYL